MLNDLKYAFRTLLKSPGFSIIAISTLALGIGANSAIFSVIETVLLRPLPFSHSERLAMIYSSSPQHPDQKRGVHSYPDYIDLRDRNHSFIAMAAYTGISSIWGKGDNSEEVPGLAATADLFDVLETKPLLGRGFSRADEEPDAARVVVLGYDFWKRRFAGDPGVIGQQVTFAGHVHTVTGVMPRGWQFPIVRTEGVDFVTPLKPLFGSSPDDELNHRGAHFLPIVGRLKAGMNLREATADVNLIAAALGQQYPDTNAGRGESAVNMQSDLVGDVRPALLVLLAAVGVVLLIACANVANLLLARAAGRRREIAIRTALGASRLRLVRQLLSETLLLALAGGALALLLSWWSIDLLIAIGPHDLPRLSEIRVNSAVVLFTFCLAALTTIVFGLVPAIQASRPELEESLKDVSRGSTSSRQSRRLRSAFVISQFALSLVLLVGAGLLIRSFAQLRALKPGFDPNRLVAFWQSLPKARYAAANEQIQFFDRLVPKLAALPGIKSVGLVSPLPFSGNDRAQTFTVVGQPPPGANMEPSASYLVTDGEYFSAMAIPLKAGRTFTAADNKDGVPVLMINEAFARKYFPNQNPLGQHVIIGASSNEPKPAREIVGIVGTSKHTTLTSAGDPETYIPFRQAPDRYMDIVVRSNTDRPSGLDSMLRHAVHEIDSEQFVPASSSVEETLVATLATPRFNMALLGLFAGVALILAAVGIYGVIAYNVSERTKEIGIRMALGAQQYQMMAMILRQSLTMAGIGIAAGLGAAFATTHLLGALIYGVSTHDFLIHVLVAVLLGAAGLVASYVPARRAMNVDPIVALRYE